MAFSRARLCLVVVSADDHIAKSSGIGVNHVQTRMCRRRCWDRAHDDEHLDAQLAGHSFVGRDDIYTRRWDMTGANTLRHYPVHDIDRDREFYPCVRSGWRDDCGIDASNPAPGIEQGAPRIVGIDRGVGLDDIGNLMAGIGRQTTLEGADHAGGQGRSRP